MLKNSSGEINLSPVRSKLETKSSTSFCILPNLFSRWWGVTVLYSMKVLWSNEAFLSLSATSSIWIKFLPDIIPVKSSSKNSNNSAIVYKLGGWLSRFSISLTNKSVFKNKAWNYFLSIAPPNPDLAAISFICLNKVGLWFCTF